MATIKKSLTKRIVTERTIIDGFTFDDVLIAPAFSEVLPKEVDITTNLTKKIKLHIPFLSAAASFFPTITLPILGSLEIESTY
jgi:IMP dehydrogenase